MLRASDFRIGSIQAAMFTPTTEAFSPSSVLAGLLSRYASRYDGPITAAPLPAEVPPEVPRIFLQSADATWRLTAGPTRIDSFWVPPNGLAAPDQLGPLTRACVEVLEHYVSATGVRVERLALVVIRGCETLNPAQALVMHFCNDDSQRVAFRHSENFEVHSHKKYQPVGVDHMVNSWVRCRTGLVGGNPGIAVENDMNTPADELHQSTLEVDQIKAFFLGIPAEVDTILSMYFPEESRP